MVSIIQALCKEHGINIKTLEEKLDLGNGAISKWKISSPKAENLQKIADYFNVSVDYLLGREKKEPSEITEDSVMLELKKLGLYDKLNGMNAEDRKIALDTFSSLCENLSKNRK